MTLTLEGSVTINSNSLSFTINDCNVNSTNLLQLGCPISIELLPNTVISYTIQLKQSEIVVDSIASSVTIKYSGVAITTINYDFKRYYF